MSRTASVISTCRISSVATSIRIDHNVTNAAIPDEFQRHLDRLAADRYELVCEIGRGAMATVFSARDRKLKRDVAVKILHHHLLADAEHRARFRREAEAIARLDHRSIVNIYDLLEDGDQFLAIVMELVVGLSLGEFIDARGPLLPELAATLVLPVAKALSTAHQAGIIHRDLKPSNILIDGDGRPVVTDFGIAHIADEATLTDAGAILGSPAYMAPEVIDGKPAQVSGDLFSLGAVLHLMVTGEAAFSGKTAPELMRNITEGRRRSSDRVNPEVGREFSVIIDGLLATAPEDRPSSAAEFADLLASFLRNSLIDPPPDLNLLFNKTERTTSETAGKVVTNRKSRAKVAISEKNRRQAFDFLERLLAISPDDDEANELLDQIHRRDSRGRLIRWSLIAAGAVIAATGLWHFATPDQPDQLDGPPEESPATEREYELLSQAYLAGAQQVEEARIMGEIAALASLAAQQVIDTVPPAGDDTAVVQYEPQPTPEVALIHEEADDDAQGETDDGPAPMAVRFRLVPASATLEVDGHEYDAVRAARGVELLPGAYDIVARGPGSETARETISIEPDAATEHQIVLNWKDGQIRLVTDRDALVWIGDDATPQSTTGGSAQIFNIPFGPADQTESRRKIDLRIADRDDLERSRRHTVEVRPGQETPLVVTLSND
jgi:eukaryotic-like serine/threonine-protein kinase